MSADLLAVFGTLDGTPSEEELDRRLLRSTASSASPAIADLQAKRQEQLWEADQSGNDVLFDASLAQQDQDDDFGDFEQVHDPDSSEPGSRPVAASSPASKPTQYRGQNEDLLSLEHDSGVLVQHSEAERPVLVSELPLSILTSEETDDWGEFEDFGHEAQAEVASSLRDPPNEITGPSSATPASQEDDWEPFDDWKVEQTVLTEPVRGTPSGDAQQSPSELAGANVQPEDIRPANIPPPKILLQLLPKVYQSLLSHAAKPSSDVFTTASAIIQAFTVSARLIAGRTLRWKRDVLLAQSTKIGPSSSRSGGMKLTSIDKHESIKEEREAADAADAWSRHAHVFSSTVTRAEIRRPWMTLSTKITPRPSPGFGRIVASHACALCGVKRDERIAGVDFDADDIFGEYWTEHWGHTDCKVFWYSYKGLLAQR